VKIIYLVKEDRDQTLTTFIEVHQQSHEVSIVNLRARVDFDQLVDQLAAADRVISW
jgi:hypothetical protein